MKLSTFGAALLLAAAAAASGHETKVGTLTIGHPYARPTAPAQPTGGGYLKLVNGGGNEQLLSAQATWADRVEMHTMRLDGDVMRMREVSAIDVPAGQTVELKPGGLHLMFIGLKAPMTLGQSYPLTLKFRNAGEVTVDVKVEAPAAGHGAASSPPAQHRH